MALMPPEVQRELAAAEAARMSGEIVLHLKEGRIESYEVRRKGRVRVTTVPALPLT